MFKKTMIFALFLLSFSCTNSDSLSSDPKLRLKTYIAKSFAVSGIEDKKGLESFLTGEAKNRLVSWDDEQFLKAFLDSKRKFEKLSFKDVKTINPNEVNITYELSFTETKNGKETKVTNKKMSYLVKEDDKWFIRDVKNIKLLVEYQNEMSLP